MIFPFISASLISFPFSAICFFPFFIKETQWVYQITMLSVCVSVCPTILAVESDDLSFTKLHMDIIPLKATPTPYFITSYNQ
jgi:hypothetical protein